MPQISDLPALPAPCRQAPHEPHAVRKVGGRVAGKPGGSRTYRCPGVTGAVLPDHSIRLRPEAFTPARVAGYGWPSLSAMGDALGVHSATLRRAVQGKTRPGERLVAQLLAGTGLAFDALFGVVPDGVREREQVTSDGA